MVKNVINYEDFAQVVNKTAIFKQHISVAVIAIEQHENYKEQLVEQQNLTLVEIKQRSMEDNFPEPVDGQLQQETELDHVIIEEIKHFHETEAN